MYGAMPFETERKLRQYISIGSLSREKGRGRQSN
jgi:hypothetical protein